MVRDVSHSRAVVKLVEKLTCCCENSFLMNFLHVTLVYVGTLQCCSNIYIFLAVL